jgi:hypothetical protein
MHVLYTILQKNLIFLVKVNIFIKISLSFVIFSCSTYRFVDDIS